METTTLTKNPHSLVMLIDDSAIDNFVNKKVISRYGFAENVIEFTRAQQALKYLTKLNNDPEADTPSVLFLDLDMPEINGFEFLSTISLLSEKIRKNMNIVILTSSINPADAEICRKSGMVLTFLHKPLMKNNLDTIDRMLSEKNIKLVKY